MDNVLSKILIVGVIIAFVVAFIIFGVALFSSSAQKQIGARKPAETAATATTDASSAPVVQIAANQPITINKIISTPVVYKDFSFTIEGQIVGWVTRDAILVKEVGEKDSKKKLLVIYNQHFGLPGDVPAGDVALGENVNVSITGTLGILSVKEGDTGFGDADSVRELMKWNKKPVIFATSVSQK